MANGGIDRRQTLAALAILAAVLLGGWLLFARHRTPDLSADEARDLTAAFLAEIRAGRIDAAWNGTAADFKSMYGRDRFRNYVKSLPILKGVTHFERCDFKQEGNLRLAECTFRPAAGKNTIKVFLCLDQRLWKIGRLAVE